MKTFNMALIVAFVLCLTSSFSFARDLSRQSPCKADIQKFCKNVKPGHGRVLRCMRQYERHLADACREHIGVVKERTKGFAKACAKDAQQFCGHVKTGQGDVYRCLKQQQEALSAACMNQVQ